MTEKMPLWFPSGFHSGLTPFPCPYTPPDGQSSLIVSSVVCAYTPRPRPDKESHGRERGTPRTMGMPYRRASRSGQEGLCGNGIPVWFCLAYNFLCSDSSILTSISLSALFQARDIMLRKQKCRPPCYRRTAEKRMLRVSALFENKKSRDS